MELFEGSTSTPVARQTVTVPELDAALTAQFAVAWAGEGGEEPRLGWWRTDLVSEYGGVDLFKRLTPATWQWAVLQATREAARRTDAELRRRDSDPDTIRSLFHFGVEVDARLDERLQDLKRGERAPELALRGLAELTTTAWSRETFADWVAGHGTTETTLAPIGRRLKGEPTTLDGQVRQLISALAPLGDAYPLPHMRVS